MKKPGLKNFFSAEQNAAVVAAIRQAEQSTSGEIRVHLVPQLSGNGYQEAAEIFEKLGMTATQERNGVLFVLGIEDHKLVVLGDMEIHRRVPPAFWEEVKEIVISEFRADRFVEGLRSGIARCGERLKEFFPVQEDDKNELSDELSHD